MVEFNDRQKSLLRGEILPANSEENDWLQDNSSTIIPGKNSRNLSSKDGKGSPTLDELPPPGLKKGELSRADPRLVDSWQRRTNPEDVAEERIRKVRGEE